MPIPQRDLLSQYGAAVLSRNASLFVGAGMSLDAGFATWGQLLAVPQKQANIPNMTDMPLLAQYYVLLTPGGREALESHILAQMSHISTTPTEGHRLVAELTIDDIWTTNYDCLLEEAMPNARVVTREEDLTKRQILTRQRITKMHGSLTKETPINWLQNPTITRSDYEKYEREHPRKWASLRASYMTRAFLFLGFSFSDPNIEILLRLSRTLLDVGGPEHFTVLKRPNGGDEERLHDLRVKDLEESGIGVHEIADYSEIVPLLQQLVRRTRQPLLFVSGSDGTNPSAVKEIGKRIGHRLADLDLRLASLAGPASFAVSFPFGHSLQANSRYSPDRISFYFRESKETPPLLPRRMGTAVYTGWTREEMLADVLPQCRAVLVLGGGDRTSEEVEMARQAQIPVIPVPTSGGTAARVYETVSIEDLLGADVTDEDRRDWENLNDSEPEIVAMAASHLVRRTMFLAASD
ncbi:SIR2 family protein [Actinomadura sp. 6K520]|uniref:SIR2 family protein n=1 Tax=Actinomadura sp. 6K520 TaxID=2530364 RepID=UPI0010439C52|nr:SIR2 family protein [Actinomadura sp. 6K520]TDE31040.1 SIR2 family protein [Actinomadura sp. 6K520]